MLLRILTTLLFLVLAPAWGGRFDLPEGHWSNHQRPGMRVDVGDAQSRSMHWDLDGLELKGTYRVTTAKGPLHVTFHVDSLTADGRPVKTQKIRDIGVAEGQDLRTVWDWQDGGGVKLTLFDALGETSITFD